MSRKFKFYENRTYWNGTLHEDHCTFSIIFGSVFLRVKTLSDKSYRENQNTHFMFSDFFFENRAVCEITWKKFLERGRPQTTIWRMRIACWIPKATNKHKLCNIYCICITRVVAVKRLIVTL